MHANSIIEQITQVVNWWYSIDEDYLNLTELMYQRKQLSGLLFYFATEMGAHKTHMKLAKADYENITHQRLTYWV